MSSRKKVLFLSTRPPYPAHKGDQIVAWNRIKSLSKKYDVHLLSFYSGRLSMKDRQHMRKHCEKAIFIKINLFSMLLNLVKGVFSSLPLQCALFQKKSFKNQIDLLTRTYDYTIIHAMLLRLYGFVSDKPDNSVLELVDSMSLNLSTRMKKAKGLKKLLLWIEWRRVQKLEKHLTDQFKALLVVSDADKKTMGDSENIHTIPNGTNMRPMATVGETLPAQNPQLLFVGNMSYEPNHQAVLWFLQNVWPLIRKQMPSAEFFVVGRSPSSDIRKFDGHEGIDITGEVDSILPYMQKADVFVAPMQSGSGMQNKVIEAMACKLPVITTSICSKGFGRALPGVLIVDEAEQMAEKTCKLLSNKARSQSLGQSAYEEVERSYRWHHADEKLHSVYESTFH